MNRFRPIRKIITHAPHCEMLESRQMLAATPLAGTDVTWKMTDQAPADGWNTQAIFDESGWTKPTIIAGAVPFDNFAAPVNYIWNGDGFDPTTESADTWYRQTFFISAAPSQAILDYAASAKTEVYINGQLVVNDSDDVATVTAGIDVASKLVAGANLIAIHSQKLNQLPGVGAVITTTSNIASPLPDLTISLAPGATLPGSLAQNQTYTVPVVINNTGNGRIDADIDLAAYFSSDAVLDDNDDLSGASTRVHVSLAPGASIDASANFKIPTDTTTGQYHIFIKADAFNQVTEISEANNAVHVDTPRQVFAEPRADLSTTVGLIKRVPSVLVPGDVFAVPVTISNAGGALAKGKIGVKVYLSSDETLDPASDLLVGSRTINLNLRPGKATRTSLGAKLPLSAAEGNFHLLVMTDEGDKITESSEENNVGEAGQTRDVAWSFGAVGNRKNVRLTRQNPTGTLAVFSLSGPGTGTVTDSGSDSSVDLTGTSASSSVSVAIKGKGAFSLADVLADAPVRTFAARNVGITGDLTFDQTLASLTIGSIGSGGTMRILGGGVPLVLVAGRITDTSIIANGGIKSATMLDWSDTDATRDRITAPAIGTLVSKGNFEAALNLSNSFGAKFALRSAAVKELISSDPWIIGGNVGSITAGSVAGWSASITGKLATLASKGNFSGDLAASAIGSFSVKGDVADSHILSGADFGSNGRIDSSDTFAAGTFSSITVGGNVSDSLFGAGFTPVDDTIGNDDDSVLGGEASFVSDLAIRGAATNTIFAGGKFLRRVRIAGLTVDPVVDPRFVTG